MVCPKCGSENVSVQSEQVSAKTGSKRGGCLWTIGRWLLIVFSLGTWLLVGRHKGSSKTKFKNTTVAICQSCGNKWKVG